MVVEHDLGFSFESDNRLLSGYLVSHTYAHSNSYMQKVSCSNRYFCGNLLKMFFADYQIFMHMYNILVLFPSKLKPRINLYTVANCLVMAYHFGQKFGTVRHSLTRI